MTTLVTCADGQVRHAPFPTRNEAAKWAEWGHACEVAHTFTELKGLTATVYYNERYRKCSIGGVGERCESVTIVGTRDFVRGALGLPDKIEPLPESSRVFAATDDAPAVVLVYRGGGHVHAEPAEPAPADTTGYMDGGSFIASTDSRFRELVGFYGAVPLHDRVER